MEKEKEEKKVNEDQAIKTLEEDEELAFIEYQENVNHCKETRRNRFILIALSTAVYLLGLGLFATIVNTIYQINDIAGIIVGSVLVILYTICFIVIICQIFSKQSFDIDMKRSENHRFSERKNNVVRFEIARNIKAQSVVINYMENTSKKEYLPKKEAQKYDAFETIIRISEKYPSGVPSYHNPDSIELSKALSVAMSKSGVIYKKAKSLIMKRALATGCLTALSQNAVVDMSVVAIKNMQLIKDLIWLYGFRPTTYEMNKIMMKVLRNVCISIGLNTLPKNATLISKIFNKDSNNFLIQLFGQVLDMGAQFLGNGTMTYLIGRYTVKILLKQYHLQEILSAKAMEEYQLEMNSETIQEINQEIEAEVKQLKNSKKVAIEDEKPLMLEEGKRHDSFFHNLFHHHKEKETKEK